MTSEYVQIELKDGTVVAGTVASVTPNMNTTLKDVKMKMNGEDIMTMDTITLRGNNIRYFVLPDAINLDAMISSDVHPRSNVMSRKRPRFEQTSVPIRGNRDKLARNASRGARGASRARGSGTRGQFSNRGQFSSRGGSTRARGFRSRSRGAQSGFHDRNAGN